MVPNGESDDRLRPEQPCCLSACIDHQSDCDENDRFVAAVEMYYGVIFNYCRFRIGSVTEAEEATENAFAFAWLHRSERDQGISKSWLYGIAQRQVSNQFRSRLRRGKLIERLSLKTSSDFSTTESGIDETQPVVRALRRLRGTDQQILMLTALDGLSPKEVADLLNCTPHAVSVRLFRAKDALRTELAIILDQIEE